MRFSVLLLVIGLLGGYNAFSQETLKSKLSSFSKTSNGQALQLAKTPLTEPDVADYKPLNSGAYQIISREKSGLPRMKAMLAPDTLTFGDTLIIGAFPGDSVVISGSYFHAGPILVLNDGYLGFKNASATVIGDVFVFGPGARLEIDSSYMFFPQLFFYQRSLVIALNGKLKVSNSTLDYSGLSHNLLATDSAKVVMENVTYSGFTTNGFYRQSEITMNGCNQAGEYVITDSSQLSFNDVHTLLLWHQVPPQASLHIDFPDGSFVSQYQFMPGQPGVSGINYTIDVTNCTEVWWALMPSGGSDVEVQNSEIRAIGLWFMGNDTVVVNGLVDNSSYSNFTAGLSDRNLKLINSSVMTWSLYPMEDAYVKVQSCIVGEIGTMGRSRCENISVFADGSGGYVWATDTTFMIMAFSSLSSSIRSDRSGILLLAYDAVTNGQVQAQGNSILMVLQSTLSELPLMYDKSCIWTANIEAVQDAFAGLEIPVFGTASINKTPTSNLMDFYAYRVLCQKSGDSTWTTISQLSLQEKVHDTLAIWNTVGLDPGSYVIKLILYDNTPDTNAVEVVRTANLLPLFMGTPGYENHEKVTLYPNPARDFIRISKNHMPTGKLQVRIFTPEGSLLKETFIETDGSINIRELKPGIYYLDFPGLTLPRQLFVKI